MKSEQLKKRLLSFPVCSTVAFKDEAAAINSEVKKSGFWVPDSNHSQMWKMPIEQAPRALRFAEEIGAALGLNFAHGFFTSTGPGYQIEPHHDQSGSLARGAVLYLAGSGAQTLEFNGGAAIPTAAGTLASFDPGLTHWTPQASTEWRCFLRLDYT